MNYTIKKFGAKSCHERVYENGTRVFFSYGTPVCAFVAGRGAVRTTTKFSATTSRHCTMWASQEPTPELISQNEIRDIFNVHEYEPAWSRS